MLSTSYLPIYLPSSPRLGILYLGRYLKPIKTQERVKKREEREKVRKEGRKKGKRPVSQLAHALPTLSTHPPARLSHDDIKCKKHNSQSSLASSLSFPA